MKESKYLKNHNNFEIKLFLPVLLRFYSKISVQKSLLLILFTLISYSASAQLKLKRSGNTVLYNYSVTHPRWNHANSLNKLSRKDTLKLPFLEDFVSTKVYPDSTRWFNNFVFVNNDFPVNPPSYGVATFDDLDSKGKPYADLNPLTFGACDSLLSLAINLKDSSGVLYKISDSIYFSFFFQRQGLGDPSDNKDSLVLQFKDNTGDFKTVWKAKGGYLSPFTFINIGILNTKYLFKGFQFRFINFSRRSGNLNQWHLDYIHLARNRRKIVTSYNDIAIQSRPTSLLKNYFQMPYDHYLADATKQKADTIFFNASNLQNTIKNVEAKQTESHKGNVLVSTIFDNNAANVSALGYAKRRFLNYNFTGLTGYPVVIKRDYEIREPGNPMKHAANDKISVNQEFNSCYAYDDGTAEYGFGYDDDVIDPFYKGAISYKFNLTKADTLWGVGMFFNRSVNPTEAFKFDLMVWQNISPPGAGRQSDDTLIRMRDLSPVFTDSINGYHVFYLDKKIVLPKGEFYIGWEQVGNFHLDVGYDINNGYHETESSSNLFWSDRGNWSEVLFKGALMMRPYLGVKRIQGKGKIDKVSKPTIRCVPNPFKDKITIEDIDNLQKVEVFDMTGKPVSESYSKEVDMSKSEAGLYSVRVITKTGLIYHQKVLKLQ